MKLDATQLLGAPELAGVKVNPPGLAKATMARGTALGGGGLLATAVQSVAMTAINSKLKNAAQADRDRAVESSAPPFRKIAWLALTTTELALLEVDARVTLRLTGTVLARAPRDTVAAIELARVKPLAPAPLTVTFTDGRVWIFEIPAPVKAKAKELIAAAQRH